MARLIDDTGSKLLETAKVLFGQGAFSAELAAEIRRPGGAERAVQALLREFQLATPTTFPIWRTLQIGGKDKAALLTELEAKGFKVGDYAREMMKSKDFTFSPEPREIDLVRVTVAELGFPDGATTQEIWDRAESLKLGLCPAEVGPHLRLQYPDQLKGEWVRVAMKQIAASDGYPSVFNVVHDDDGRWLNGSDARPEDEWCPDRTFVFVRPRA